MGIITFFCSCSFLYDRIARIAASVISQVSHGSFSANVSTQAVFFSKASSRVRYEQDIRNHIKPAIGHINLQDLKLLHVQRLLNQCKEKKNLAQKSVKNIYLVLNKALKKAQSQGLIRQNPCDEAEIPSYDTPQKEMRPLKDHEIPAFLSAIKSHPLEYLFYIALFTSLYILWIPMLLKTSRLLNEPSRRTQQPAMV